MRRAKENRNRALQRGSQPGTERVTDPIDRIPQTPPAWALRERDARRDGDPRRPKQPAARRPADEPDDDAART